MAEVDSSLAADVDAQRWTASDAELQWHITRRLGQVVGYLAGSAAGVRDGTLRPVLPQALHDSELVLDAIDTVTTRAADDPAAALAVARTALYTPFLLKETLASEMYPGVSFYKEILDTDDIPPVAAPSPDQAVTIRIIGPAQIEINGSLHRLKGDVLYMFNALLAHRYEPASTASLLAHGFQASSANSALNAMWRLYKLLGTGLPEGEPIEVTGKNKGRTWQLASCFVIEDARERQNQASLTTELAPVSGRQRTIGSIAREAGVTFNTARRLITDTEWETQDEDGRFSDEVAELILAQCIRYRESFKELGEVTELCESVAELVRSLPGNARMERMDTTEAVRALEAAGLAPFRLRARGDDAAARRGGWWVSTAGAEDALLRAVATIARSPLGPKKPPLRRTRSKPPAEDEDIETRVEEESDLEVAAEQADVAVSPPVAEEPPEPPSRVSTRLTDDLPVTRYYTKAPATAAPEPKFRPTRNNPWRNVMVNSVGNSWPKLIPKATIEKVAAQFTERGVNISPQELEAIATRPGSPIRPVSEPDGTVTLSPYAIRLLEAELGVPSEETGSQS